ncbi:MAG: class I SAM-dependent methyltransferase [Candidatus Gracilibacteria bacterium]|jgi:ubiquinone/menaquinone biosynthesis C-methylase UbiE
MLGTRIDDHADYVAPDDYRRLLKPYSSRSIEDLALFAAFINEVAPKIAENRAQFDKVLELGCGPGRSTQSFMDTATAKELHLLDLSPKMLDRTRTRYADLDNLKYIEADTTTHLEGSNERYDLIYSLWSFSHSVHQILTRESLPEAESRVKYAIRRMIVEMMKPGAGFFLIHVDSKSEEQTILFRQWAKLYPIFSNGDVQTPSKLIFDEVLDELGKEGIIKYSIEQIEMDGQEYSSFEELLDIFLNFHLESQFNDLPDVEGVIDEIKKYVEQFKQPDGTYVIKPGCFIYKVIKNN